MKLKYVRVQYSSVKLEKRPTLRAGRAPRAPDADRCLPRGVAVGGGGAVLV